MKRLSRKDRLKHTIMMKAYDKGTRVLGKGILLTAMPVMYSANIGLTMVTEHKSLKKAYQKVDYEYRRRLNKGIGRGKEFPRIVKKWN